MKMLRPKNWQIRNHLIAIVIAFGTGMVGWAIWVNCTLEQTLINQAKLETNFLSETIAERHKSISRETHQFLLTLTHTEPVRTLNTSRMTAFFTDIQKNLPQYSNIIAVYPDGFIRSCSAPVELPVDVSKRSWFKRVSSEKTFVVDEFIVTQSSGTASLPFVLPILDENNAILVILGAALNLSYYNDVFSEYLKQNDDDIFLLDPYGRILFSSSYSNVLGKPSSDVLPKEISNPAVGSYEFVNNNNSTMLYWVQKIILGNDGNNFTLIVGTQKSNLLKKSRKNLYINILTSIVIASISSVLLFVYGKIVIYAPLERLIETTKAVSKGNLSVRTGSNYCTTEFEVLAKEIDAMISSLEDDYKIRSRAQKELQASHDLLSQFIKHSPIYAFIKEVTCSESKMLIVSDNFKNITGIHASEMIGKNMKDIFPNDFAEIVTKDDLLAISGGDITHSEADFNGRKYRIIKFPIIFCGKNLIAGYSIDVTEQRKSEDALRDAERKYRILINNSQSIIYEITTEGILTFVSPSWKQLLGHDPEEVIMHNFKPFVHSDDHFICDELLRETESSGKVQPGVEYRVLCKNGTVRWHRSVLTPVVDSENGSKKFVGNSIDITEHKRAEDELRRQENQLQRIFEILPIGLWFADQNGKLLRGNPMGRLIWGMSPNIPLTTFSAFRAWRIPSMEPIEPHNWALMKTVREGVTIIDELLEIETFDGKRKTILNYSAPVLDNEGKIDGAIAVNLDISDRKTLEKQLLQAQKMESIGRLAGGVAHDFNNMLSVILGQIDLITAKLPPNQEFISRLQSIREAAERSADLTRQLLAFARKQTVSPKVLDLNSTVEGMLNMLRRLIGENIDLAWLPTKNDVLIKIDPTQIDQILVNLCVNARDSIGGTGRITIETEVSCFDEQFCTTNTDFSPGKYVLLTIGDNGNGMDNETLSHLFEPFFTTKDIGKGTGLGLATVYGIVTQNKGFINVYSEPGQGAKFKIFLPRHDSKEKQEAKQNIEKPIPRGAETILLVEDEKMILDIAVSMLEHLGYTVISASDPSDAIKIFVNNSSEISLLITDVIMPEMNGRELADKLMSIKPNLRLLFASGYTANIISKHGVLDDSMLFMQKPFSLKELAVKVRAALDGELVETI